MVYFEVFEVGVYEFFFLVEEDDGYFFIFLFDEVEKVYLMFWNGLLYVFEEGELMFGDNSKMNFWCMILFMMLNVGSCELDWFVVFFFGFVVFEDVLCESNVCLMVLEVVWELFFVEFFNWFDL